MWSKYGFSFENVCRLFSVSSQCNYSCVLSSSRSHWELELIILDVPFSMGVQKYVYFYFLTLLESSNI